VGSLVVLADSIDIRTEVLFSRAKVGLGLADEQLRLLLVQVEE
jgi:hypothetical protein